MATGSKTWPQGVANTLDAIKLAISEMSDEVYMAESKTSMLTPNPALVRGFQQSKTGQLSSLTMDGLGNYDKQVPSPSDGRITPSRTTGRDHSTSTVSTSCRRQDSSRLDVSSRSS